LTTQTPITQCVSDYERVTRYILQCMDEARAVASPEFSMGADLRENNLGVTPQSQQENAKSNACVIQYINTV